MEKKNSLIYNPISETKLETIINKQQSNETSTNLKNNTIQPDIKLEPSISSTPSNTKDVNTKTDNSSSTTDTKSVEEEQDWKGFGISILTILFIMIIWCLLGINLLYFLFIRKEDLENIFPTDKNKTPYSDGTFMTNIIKKGGYIKETTEFKQNEELKTNINKQIENIEKTIKIAKLNVYGFPYKWKETDNFLHPKYFISNTILNSYINGRTAVKQIFNFFSDFEIGKNILFLLAPLILYLFIFIIPIISYIISFFAEINTGIFSTFLYSFIFGISFILPFIISITQTLQLFISLFLLPFFINTKKMEILEEQFPLISFIFCLLVSLSAINRLGLLFGFIVTIILTIVYGVLYKLLNSS